MRIKPAKDIVVQKQIDWAWRTKKTVTTQGYFVNLEDNLLQPLSAIALNGFGKGSGSELIGTDSRPAKIKALHSSAALAVNFFDYWTVADTTPLAAAIQSDTIEGPVEICKIKFERQYPTGLGGNPPNLDVAIQLESGFTIAIESKFTEWMSPKAAKKEVFRPAYFANGHGVWRSRGLPCCQDLAEAMAAGKEVFRWLDVSQLLKHALGLATAVSEKFALYYIYFDVDGTERNEHAKDIERFSAFVGKEIRFVPQTYQALFKELAPNAAKGHIQYVSYLRDRYFYE